MRSYQSFIGCICLILFSVCFHMRYQSACQSGCIFTLVAFVWIFSTVIFQVGLRNHCPRGWNITLAAYVLLLIHCVFLNGSVNCLYWSMHSHICCLCLTSPLGVCLICALKAWLHCLHFSIFLYLSIQQICSIKQWISSKILMIKL